MRDSWCVFKEALSLLSTVVP